MPAFLDDISSFYGTGEKNGKGQTLEEFLEEYDPYKYKNPCATTDAVVFSYAGEQELSEKKLKVLLVKRGNHPSIGYWALPGGFVNLKENLEQTARRELEEETGVKGLPVEQFACYGAWNRDPRARVITTAYFSLVKEQDVKVHAGDDAADAAWFQVTLEPAAVSEEKYNHAEDPKKSGEEKLGTEEEEQKKTVDVAKTEATEEWAETEWLLKLKNEERGIETQARIVKRVRHGLVRETYYEVKDGGLVAVDHAAILTQALMILLERI